LILSTSSVDLDGSGIDFAQGTFISPHKAFDGENLSSIWREANPTMCS